MTPPRPAPLGDAPTFPEGLPLVRPTLEDIAGISRRIDAVLTSGQLTNGSLVRELEERLAERLEVPHVVAVANCTAGLMLTLQAVGVDGPVVLPSFTFAASAHAVAWAGGTPTFAEIETESLTLDPDDVAQHLDGASAILPTHIYGTPCQVERLQQIADDAGIPLVYDAAHALGSRRGGPARRWLRYRGGVQPQPDQGDGRRRGRHRGDP